MTGPLELTIRWGLRGYSTAIVPMALDAPNVRPLSVEVNTSTLGSPETGCGRVRHLSTFAVAPVCVTKMPFSIVVSPGAGIGADQVRPRLLERRNHQPSYRGEIRPFR